MTPDRDQAMAMLRAMTRIRRLEERCAEDYAAAKIRGFLHLYIGQEAIAAGVIPALTVDDSVVATYREHGHALLRGISASSIMAEMYGKAGGCSRGRGGSMHLFSREHRFFGGHGIVGGGLPVAIGIALADKLRGSRAITCVFFGEGATAEGEFHESLNLVSLWRLPVLFVCENNLYAMGTALARSEAEGEIHKKAAVHRIGSEVVDGMDVIAVQEAATQAIERVRETGAPWFLECLALWVILRGFGEQVSVTLCFFFYATSTLAGAIIPVPGGLGVTEEGLREQMIQAGKVGAATSTAAMMLVRFATLWFAVLIGFLALGALKLRHPKLLRAR